MPWALARGEERKGTRMRARFVSLAGGRFGGTERPNRARKGLCDAGIAPQTCSINRHSTVAPRFIVGAVLSLEHCPNPATAV